MLDAGSNGLLIEPEELAAEAGLRYVEAGAPGYSRVRRGSGFSYIDPDGDHASDVVRKRISALAIPPAWSDVWIARDRRAHIVATGVDDAGRKQYIYHPDWEAAREALKFERLASFGNRLGSLRKRLRADLGSDDAKQRSVSLAICLLDASLIRVGNTEYAQEHEAYGLTTIRREHVQVKGGQIRFEFVGKGGAERQVVLDDDTLAESLTASMKIGGDTLLSFDDGSGVRSVTSTDVNLYLRRRLRTPVTAKSFRTWGATSIVVGELAKTGSDQDGDSDVLAAIDAAAERLGNTRDVCRNAYVHPAVIEAHAGGQIARAWKESRSGTWLSREESTTNRLLT